MGKEGNTMTWQFTPYAVPLFVGAALMLGIGLFSWQRRAVPSAAILFLLSLAAIFYAAGYAFEIGSLTTDQVLFWLKVQYIGITPASTLLLALALAHTGRHRFLTPFTWLLLLIMPATTLIFAWTNELHELIWRGVTLDRSAGFTRTIFTPGAWYWVSASYFLLLLAAAIIMLVVALWRASGLYRRQLAVLTVGMLFPLLIASAYFAHLTPRGLDVNPYGLMLTGITVGWGLFNYRLLDAVPVAHAAVCAGISDAVLVLDAQARVVDLNPAAARLIGSSTSQIAGRPAAQALESAPAILNVLRDPGHADVDLSVTGESGPRYFNLRQSELHSPRGRPIGWVVVLRDITRRVQAEEALREANERLTVLRRVDGELTRRLNVSYVCAVALDAAMRISLADAAFIALAEERGLRILSGLGDFPPEALQKVFLPNTSITFRVIRTGEPELILDVSEDPEYLELVPGTRAQISVPLISRDKRIGALTLETRHPERFTGEVFGAVRLLAARIAAAIDNAQAYEEREKLVQELEAFAHTVAHDLKGPLSVLLGYVQLLQDTLANGLTPPILDLLDGISRSSWKMVNIIDELLLLASARKMETIPIGPLDMGAIVAEARTRLATSIEQAGAQIIAPDEWPVAVGYGPWVEEVWVNYLSNAIKYGGTPPRVEVGAALQPDGKVRFWVRDNGQGLSAEEQAQLFKEFARLNQVRVKGHGLGLSIVRRIIERLGGEVGVMGNPGGGSLFYFTLPVANPASEPATGAAQPESPGAI